MNFTSVRLILANFERIANFYEHVSGQPVVRATPSFAELRTVGGTLAIGYTSTLAPFGGEQVASPAANRTAIIEFRVADVDADYQRLAECLGDLPRPRWQPGQFFYASYPAAIEKFARQPAM
ncbi:hypothetical protein [Hymenobacter coccineus]|uniref:Glyoxalase n=1 Tax=Hymenobacter coccineus TaxID=1908235 RepID=A0A1G1SU92_9BACT|nr:hypothetical protein [Hymenobacter coccineus]OGX82166.1 hypothetical protein BEN49_14475 [Hymenobacter coccineus]